MSTGAAADQPLAGLRIVNPRPAAQAQALTEALTAAGATVIALPLLEISALPQTPATRTCLMALDRYDATVFVSANAARLGLDAVADLWPQWPHQLPAYAVGAATAELLSQAALPVFCPEQEDSEGLLAMPALAEVQGQRWLIFRGDDGRALLIDSLRERGATVDVLPLYTRSLPAAAHSQWQALAAEVSSRPDVVLLSSALVWQHWQALAGEYALEPILVAVSERLAETLRQAGARQVICAQGAGTHAWLQALSLWRRHGTHSIR